MEDVTMYQEWWVPLIGTIVTAIAAIFTYVMKRGIDWFIAQYELNQNEKEALQALLEGMAAAQEDIVREAKAASADGKLTKAEIELARQRAWIHAKTITSGPVKEVVLSWTEKRVASLIKQLLAKFKTKVVKEPNNVSANIESTVESGD